MLNNQFSVSLDEVQKIEIHSLFFISLLLVCNEPNMGMVLVAVMLHGPVYCNICKAFAAGVSFCFTSGMSGSISPHCEGWSLSEALQSDCS